MESTSKSTKTAVVIIGAGISGLCTAIDMIRHNHSRDFIIVEKASEVGGTWNDNRYPGSCCDVASHLYSYSFEPNPLWTRDYPGQEEILAYLIHVAERWGLYQHIRFNTEVVEAQWDEESHRWHIITTSSPQRDAEPVLQHILNADFLVSGVGQLNHPYFPPIAGLEMFQGKVMHSARWDCGYEFQNKKVAVIGNGATAAQIIPEISKLADSVSVYQRTPNWVIPRGDREIGKIAQWGYQNLPYVRMIYRAVIMSYREKFYDAAVNPKSWLHGVVRGMSLDLLNRQIPDNQDLRKKLVPDYPPGCKRIIISDDYFAALNKPHVTLETTTIHRVDETGISTENGEHRVFDIIVLATGFRATEFLHPIKVAGLGHRSLQDVWKKGPRAYLGISVESMPNFGILYGPNTNLGHNSIILMIETQSRYINALISAVLMARSRGEHLTILPKAETVETYNEEIQDRLTRTTFADPRCSSWYKTSDGHITNNWCGTVVEYQKRLSQVVWSDYTIFGTKSGAWIPNGTERLGRVVEEIHLPRYLIITGIGALGVLFWFKKRSV
ncbi:monooxygenase [Paecilomyces variotii No. 5]|uniref:Monooxygenase n=1 Tax=Byssochlamys spectabilis (strain No. 5 / NBRC 109023) TaxID=1356009 RepID=V5GH14_BYSSN|nr:monooxygenase [Paecilomyces variotii No. 5]